MFAAAASFCCHFPVLTATLPTVTASFNERSAASTCLVKMPPKKKKKKRAAETGDPKKELPWRKHPAKVALKEMFKDGTISVDYSTEGGPRKVWNEHCQDHPAFSGMNYTTTFTNRLRSVKDDYKNKTGRAADDKKAYDNFRRLFPVETHNHKGEPRWEGSRAQELLREDMDNGRPTEDENPKDLHEDPDRPEYLEFNLDTFRNHIHQEKRLRKYLNWLEQQEEEKAAKAKT